MTTPTAMTDQSWREAQAAALDAKANAVTDALAHVENVALALEGHEDLTAAGRTYTGFLRTARNDLASEARSLRAKGE